MIMPGGSSVSINDPTVERLFAHAISVQLLWVAVVAVLAVAVILIFRQRTSVSGEIESRARTYLRWSFGILWLIDGVLQHQGSMPLGLANQVITPATAGTPSWLHALMLDGVGLWNRFPIALASATMWIELGIGLLLLSSRGSWSRAAGALSAGWALLVWVLGNGMGGIFSSGISFLFGWPGASLLYVVAGAWLALPPKTFDRHFSKWTLRGVALLSVMGIVVQAWPANHFWIGGPLNAVRQMTHQMASLAQPSWLAALVNGAGRLSSLLGGGMNLIVIYWLAMCAVGLWRASSRDEGWSISLFVVGCLVVWVTVQDAAVFGGLSTDLNSMVPLALLVACASPRVRAGQPIAVTVPEASRRSLAIVSGAVGVAMAVVAVIPMLGTTVSAGAETTGFLATSNQVLHEDVAAPAFRLTSQDGRTFTFPTHNDRYTVMTFLDPSCYTDCSLLSHQLTDLQGLLSASERTHLQIVAVAANPARESVRDLRVFIRKNYLSPVAHFHFVTGPIATMQKTWADYHIEVRNVLAGIMSVHSDVMYIIDPRGRIRVVVADEPSSSWATTTSTAEILLSELHGIGLR